MRKGYDTICLDYNPSGPPYVVLTRASGNPAPPVDAGSTGAVKDIDFMRNVVGAEPPSMFLDRAALHLSSVYEHGAPTHFLQDLAIDRKLRPYGVTAVQFRAMLNQLDSTPGFEGKGTALWLELHDASAGLGEPENMWGKAIRPTLGFRPREL
jgi:hypothetical protein